jgi:hypothetical protein
MFWCNLVFWSFGGKLNLATKAQSAAADTKYHQKELSNFKFSNEILKTF